MNFKKVLIFVDNNNTKSSLELLEVADRIFEGQYFKTSAVCFNQIDILIENKFDFWIRALHEGVGRFDVINISECIFELNTIYEFDCILIPATFLGRMVAPRLAMLLNVGLVADVTEIGHKESDGEVLLIRPAFDGKILASISVEGQRPIMASVRENVFCYSSTQSKDTQILDFRTSTIKNSNIKLVDMKKKSSPKDIRESEILVSGGGGVASDFEHIKALADVLSGMTSASRHIIDSGIAGRSIQVGQSGKTVSPKLYIALGIYGSLQHIEGLKNVENIISVNIDRNAPICSLSDIVVEGDALLFVDKLTARIKKSKNE